jgi:hypothetical protein
LDTSKAIKDSDRYRRDQRLVLRVSAAEQELISTGAEHAGIPVPTFMRIGLQKVIGEVLSSSLTPVKLDQRPRRKK